MDAVTTIPVDHDFLADHLAELPDDGNRYELLDGLLLIVLKRRAYERAGLPSYWLVDPDVPALSALELQDGRYVEVARVEHEQQWAAALPYAVSVVPGALLR